MNFAQVLRDSRQLGGLTQSQLSTRSGINQSVISAYERGRREPGAETFLMLIEAAGLDFIIRVPITNYQHPTLPDSAQTRALVKHRQAVLALAAQFNASNVRILAASLVVKLGPIATLTFWSTLDQTPDCSQLLLCKISSATYCISLSISAIPNHSNPMSNPQSRRMFIPYETKQQPSPQSSS